eukprot:8215182-Lingulodinium_polyedra.AAC.1
MWLNPRARLSPAMVARGDLGRFWVPNVRNWKKPVPMARHRGRRKRHCFAVRSLRQGRNDGSHVEDE